MKNLIIIILAFITLSILSCGPDYLYEKSFELENAEWTYKDTLDFSVDISDTLKIYNLYLDIEHSATYSNQNLYVMISTRFPSGQRIKERVSLELANKAGQWYGDCNSEWCKLRMIIQEGAFFNAEGNHLITVEQFMRVNPLPGINSLALRIEDMGESRVVAE